MLTKSKFRAAWWLRNPHLQTLWAAKIHHAPTPAVKFERITTPDDDFIDLCWSLVGDGPLIIIFHGLTGSYRSPYVRALMSSLQTQHISSVLMHFRGCSGEPNTTPGAYHSGHTKDIQHTVNLLSKRFPQRALIAVGYSLGGNALLKYLAKTDDCPLQYAISVCPPLLLAEGAKRINEGFSRVYQATLIKQMRNAMRDKHSKYPELSLQKYSFDKYTNFTDWDHHVTAPLHGFASGDDYYKKASTLSDLRTIAPRTHVICSKDDPFFTERCLPVDDSQLSAQVTFEVVSGAGHVGFIEGAVPFFGRDWLRRRLVQLVTENIASL